MLRRRSSSILAASPPNYWEQDQFTVNRIFDSASILDCNSDNALPTEGAGMHAEVMRPLSSAQLGIWLAQQIAPDSPAYNIGEYVEIHGPVEPHLFERSLRLIVAEADALRLRIVECAGTPRQVIGASPTWSMPFVDLSAEADARAVAESWMRFDLARPIDPTREPLFGFALFKASPDRYFWYARYHHLAIDGFTMWLVARRVAEVYTALGAGSAVGDVAPGSFAVLLEQDAAYRQSARFGQDRQFWLDALSDWPDPGFGNPAS